LISTDGENMNKNIFMLIVISFFVVSLQAHPKIYNSLNEELANFSSNCQTIQSSKIFPTKIQRECKYYVTELNAAFSYGEKLEEDLDALKKNSKSYLIKIRDMEKLKSKLTFELVKLKRDAMKENNHKLYSSIVGMIKADENDYSYMQQHKRVYAKNPVYQKQEAKKETIRSSKALLRKEQLQKEQLAIAIATNIETAKSCEALILQLHDKASFKDREKYKILESEYSLTLQTNFNVDQNKTRNYKDNEWASTCIANKNPRVPEECFRSCRDVLSWREKDQVEYDNIVSVYDDVFGAKECSPFTNPMNEHFPQITTGTLDVSNQSIKGWVMSFSAPMNSKTINIDISDNTLYAPNAYFEKERGACSGPLVPVSEEEYDRLTQ